VVEERGYKKGRGKEEKGGVGVLLRIVGVGCDCLALLWFWETLETYGGFLGLERRKVSLSGFAHSS